ncbi:MAG: signal peptidase I [Thiolinea sp.]
MAFVFSSIVIAAAAALYLPPKWTVPVMLASAFLSAFIWVYSLLEATFDAKHKKQYQPFNWQGGGVYLLVFVALFFVFLPLASQYIKDHLVEAYRIPSASMEPTLVAGDFIFADKRYNCPGCQNKVERGDVVVFTYPNNRNTNYIKRIIGLPGDRVQINGETLKINGKTISKVIQQQDGMNVIEERNVDGRWIVVWKKIKNKVKAPVYDIKVPPGHVFVLGDNRNASNDSRFFDTVPLADIKGKARQIWLSYNRKLGGLRMDRAGKFIQ